MKIELDSKKFRINLFSAPRIFDQNGRPISVTSRKTLALIGILASQVDVDFGRSKIAGMLWDRVEERQARKSLRQSIIELKRIFAGADNDPVTATRDAIRLNGDVVTTDLEALLQDDVIDASHYSEPFFTGFDGLTESLDEWIFQERAHKTGVVRRWHEDRLVSLQSTNAPWSAQISAARQLLAFDAAHERAWRVLIEGLSMIGDVGQALSEYKACERALKRTLDVRPSAETRALRHRISQQAATAVISEARNDPAAILPSPSELKATIAVLPLIRLTNDSRTALVANGLLEGVIHVLSGVGDLAVISRGSVVQYASRRMSPTEVGLELGVRYLLSGTITSYGNKLALYLELSESENGAVLWTEKKQIHLGDLFAIQNEVATEVAIAIAPNVRANELARARRKPPASMTAYDLLLQGLSNLYHLDSAVFDTAGAHFRRAMELDPTYAAVRSHAATWHIIRVAQGWSDAPAQDSGRAAELSSDAIALDNADATALAIKGQILSFTRREYDEARAYLDEALRVGPSCQLAWSLSSATYGWTGDSENAIAHAERALKLSPFDPFAYFAEHMLSQGHYIGGDFQKAVFWGRRSANRNGRLTSNLRTLTAALVANGDLDEARSVASTVNRLDPGFKLASFEARTPFSADIRKVHVERLREAGFS